jgi:DNA-binding beta-propeller fold protein YncE
MFYGGVLQYVLAGDGSLSPITPAVAAAPHGIAATTVAISQGSSPVVAVPQYAYVANNGDSTVSQYTIDANGGLAAMANPTVATGAHPAAVTVDPSGRYAYVVNFSDNTLSQYTIGADGSLAPMTPATVVTDVTPVAIVIDPSGTYAYVANAGAYNANTNSYAPTVSQYSISSSGALQPLSPALFTWGSGDGLNAIAVDPSGQNVYVVSSHSLWQFTRNGFNAAATVPFTATGSLAPTVLSPSTLSQGIDFTFDPSGRFAYAQDVLLEQYTVGGTGTLTAITTPTAIGGGASVVVDPSGKYVYAADGATQLSQYSMGSDGALTSLTPANVADANRPWAMVVDPSGNYAYVANIGNNTVSQYTIGSGGALTAMSTPAVPAGTLNFNHPGKIIALCGTWH